MNILRKLVLAISFLLCCSDSANCRAFAQPFTGFHNATHMEEGHRRIIEHLSHLKEEPNNREFTMQTSQQNNRFGLGETDVSTDTLKFVENMKSGENFTRLLQHKHMQLKNNFRSYLHNQKLKKMQKTSRHRTSHAPEERLDSLPIKQQNRHGDNIYHGLLNALPIGHHIRHVHGKISHKRLHTLPIKLQIRFFRKKNGHRNLGTLLIKQLIRHVHQKIFHSRLNMLSVKQRNRHVHEKNYRRQSDTYPIKQRIRHVHKKICHRWIPMKQRHCHAHKKNYHRQLDTFPIKRQIRHAHKKKCHRRLDMLPVKQRNRHVHVKNYHKKLNTLPIKQRIRHVRKKGCHKRS